MLQKRSSVVSVAEAVKSRECCRSGHWLCVLQKRYLACVWENRSSGVRVVEAFIWRACSRSVHLACVFQKRSLDVCFAEAVKGVECFEKKQKSVGL